MDDDSKDDGIKKDDVVGTAVVQLGREEGEFNQLIDGHGALHAFRLAFKYRTVFHSEPTPEELDVLLASGNKIS